MDRVIEKVAEPSKNAMKVGVYGSLRKGHGNHALLADSKYLGKVKINGFEMYDLGAFPGACYAQEGTGIVLELYEVEQDVMTRLDWLEGHPDFYERFKIQNVPIVGRAWVYVLPKDRVEGCPVVTKGDWNEYRENLA